MMANPKGAAKLIPRSFRMTAAEHAQIDRIAQKLGKTPAELMRDTFRMVIQKSRGGEA
jgi:hypothetical protein